MENSMEMEGAPVPAAPRTGLTLATKTSLSERFQQMCQEPAAGAGANKVRPKVKKVMGGGKTRKAVPDFDLEHYDDGLGLPKHRVRTGGLRSLGLGQPMGNELFALQLAARQRQEFQNQRIIAQARLAAQAELVALLGTTTTGYSALGYGYGHPSVPRQSRAGLSRTVPASPGMAMALAQTPQIPTPMRMRARLGVGRGQTHPGGLGCVRKGPGSIVKTNMSGLGRGRGTTHGNMSLQGRQPPPIGFPSGGLKEQNWRRMNGGNGIGMGLSGPGFKGGKWKGEPKTKEELDHDIDQYMSQKRKSTKSLDMELDAYMAQAKAATAAATTQSKIQSAPTPPSASTSPKVLSPQSEPLEEMEGDLKIDVPVSAEVLGSVSIAEVEEAEDLSAPRQVQFDEIEDLSTVEADEDDVEVDIDIETEDDVEVDIETMDDE